MAYGSFEEGGITVESSDHTSEALAANLTPVVDDTVVVEDGEAPESVAPVASPEPKPNPRKDPQARVEAATAKEAAAKRERDEAKAEAAKLTARIAELEARTKPEPVKPQVVAAADPEPTVDQFDSYEKFVKAQARWEARQEIRQQETERAKHTAQQQREWQIREVDQQFSTRYQAVLAEDPEFPSKVDPRLLSTPRSGVLTDPSTATFGNFLVEQVFQSEHPKDLLLHLSDPAIVQRLATLPPVQVIRELAKFEALLGVASPAAPAPKVPVSHAKPPIQPLGTSHVTGTDPNEITGEESVDEHIRKMNAADRRARRAS